MSGSQNLLHLRPDPGGSAGRSRKATDRPLVPLTTFRESFLCSDFLLYDDPELLLPQENPHMSDTFVNGARLFSEVRLRPRVVWYRQDREGRILSNVANATLVVALATVINL